MMKKNLPNGVWITFGNFPTQATDEDFQQWLKERYIDAPLDRISVSNAWRAGSMAIVSFDGYKKQTQKVFDEVRRRIDLVGREFLGRELRIFCRHAENAR